MTEENKLNQCPVLREASNGVEISEIVKACIECDLRKAEVEETTQ